MTGAENETLKPCPWGHKAERIADHVGDTSEVEHRVQCSVSIQCPVMPRTSWFPTAAEAIAAWNAQAPLPVSDQREGMVGELERVTRERDEAAAALRRKQFMPDAENAMEAADKLEGASWAEKNAACSADGKCLICGLDWRHTGDPALACPHDEVQVIAFLRTISAAYVDCICHGCPRKVPMAWMSGMCGPCAAEDCEHADGAKARIEELEEEVAALQRQLDASRAGAASPTVTQPLKFTVVIAGRPHPMTYPDYATVALIMSAAVMDTGNTGRPSYDWELRNLDGGLIHWDQTLKQAGIAEGATLFMNPRAGVGGSRAGAATPGAQDARTVELEREVTEHVRGYEGAMVLLHEVTKERDEAVRLLHMLDRQEARHPDVAAFLDGLGADAPGALLGRSYEERPLFEAGFRAGVEMAANYLDGPWEYKGEWSKWVVVERAFAKDAPRVYPFNQVLDEAICDAIDGLNTLAKAPVSALPAPPVPGSKETP